MPDHKPKFENLLAVFESAVKEYSSRPLFGTKRGSRWEWTSYGEFQKLVDHVRGGLATLGVQRGDRVAIISNNRVEWAAAAFASYGLGAAFVPMYESQIDKDWLYILGDCGAKVVFVANDAIADRVQTFRNEIEVNRAVPFAGMRAGSVLKEIVVLDHTSRDDTTTFAQLVRIGKDNPVPALVPAATDIAGFIYTSGTTGNPKGVLLSHLNFAANVSAIHAVFPMAPNDRSLSFLPWAHSFGQTCELYGLFSLGASIAVNDKQDALIANLADVQPTLLFSVPRIFNKIYDALNRRMAEAGGIKKKMFDAALANAQERKQLAAQGKTSGLADFKQRMFDRLVFSKVRERFGGRLNYAFSGGAALSKEVADFIDNLGIMVYEGYGLTETSPIATANYPGSRKIGSVGRPIPGTRVEIDTSESDDPEQGEIIVVGHNVMQGYFGLPEENDRVFVDCDGERGFRTGDMGRVDEDGFLYITGRIKEQYKLLNGKYVVPTPLEEGLKLSPYVANVMIHGMNKNYNVALIVPDFESLKSWADAQDLPADDPKAIIQSERLKELIDGELEKYSTKFKQYEKIKRFTFCAEDFTTENGMLTPSLKLKRRAVLERYGDTIEQLFSD